MCDVFGWCTPLETWIAKFVTSGIVLESKRKIRLVTDTVIHFLHMVRCHFRWNVPASQIIHECRILQRLDFTDVYRASRLFPFMLNPFWNLFPLKRKRISGWILFQSADSTVSVTSVLLHHKVDERAALTRPEVTPQIYTVIHLETGRIILTERTVVHAVIIFIHCGQNA